MKNLVGTHIHITGIVQGVGFRPFIYKIATQTGLYGWVRNTSSGVDIQIDSTEDDLSIFLDRLENELPPLARIDSVQVQSVDANGFSTFEIKHSKPIPGAFIPISPDVSICDDCLRELFDPKDPRYRYPFINCTNCGPRFTIIEDIPYDRPNTTMAPFELCDYCKSQYENPLDRRFHAQPVACNKCGPHVWFEHANLKENQKEFEQRIKNDDAIIETQKSLSQGKILAIKGLGGFHLACDATNENAVMELRSRKLRVDKPFALMIANIETIEENCIINQKERDLLLSRQRPIVLVKRKDTSRISKSVAPYQDKLGVMLPYTPMHYLIFAEIPNRNIKAPNTLVMTSANLSEEPIAIENDEARQRLADLADAFLMHNREIRTRCDDSVVTVINNSSKDRHQFTDENGIYPIRRSRGYTPNPIQIPWNAPQILATGPELKNTFCFTKDQYAFLSQHIGDMENYETLQSFEDGIHHFEKLFRLKPEIIAYDLHPNYFASRYAIERAKKESLPSVGIQHHHAHIAACMVDNNINDKEPVIGVSFDGTGYGDDGNIWGGEFLIATYQNYSRYAHLEYHPLPGGDSSTRKPYRIALAYLWAHKIPWEFYLSLLEYISQDEIKMLNVMLENQINSPLTSSVGRLFDAIAALIGIRSEVNYEAHAAI